MATAESTTATKKWADGPLKLLSTPRAALNGKPESPASKNASEMALLHNVLLRALNSISIQAPNISQSSDFLDFLSYCSSFSLTLRSHHNTEETVYFPLLDKMCTSKGVAAKNHDEHETFLAALEQFDTLIEHYRKGVEGKEGGNQYNGEELQRLVDKELGPPLEAHLRSEVDMLVALEADESIDWVLLGKTMAAHSKKTADRVREVPFIIANSDITYESGIHGPRFPPFPWFVHQIFRWIYIPQMKGAWRFASCDDYGVPQELPFA